MAICWFKLLSENNYKKKNRKNVIKRKRSLNWKKQRWEFTKRENSCSLVHSSPGCNNPICARLKPPGRNSILISHMLGTDLSTPYVFCSFANHFSRGWIRNRVVGIVVTTDTGWQRQEKQFKQLKGRVYKILTHKGHTLEAHFSLIHSLGYSCGIILIPTVLTSRANAQKQEPKMQMNTW